MDFTFKILIFVLHLHLAVTYKLYKFNKLCPTTKFNRFVEYILENKPVVELEDSNNLSAAVISTVWDEKTYKNVENCDFKVIAKSPRDGSPHGIYAFIRKMNLRNGTTDCIDYVKFEMGSGKNLKSQKMCGNVEDKQYVGDNFFDAPNGTLRVVIYISRYARLEYGQSLLVELIFTQYDDCSDAFQLECETKKCISTDFLNDTVHNCPPPDCRDEPGIINYCKIQPTYRPSSHVLAISALTSLLIVLFGIVTCWYCFKFRNCRDFAQSHNSNIRSRSGTARPEMEFETIQVPATPDGATNAPPSMEDNDHPPSYESLFKDRKVI